MLSYVVRRLLWGLMVCFVITLVTFVMFFVLPDQSTSALRNERGFGIQEQYGVHGSFVHQYVGFLKHIVVDRDLGESTQARGSVTDVLKRTVPVTISLIGGGVVIWLLLAFPIGFLSAMRPRSLLDKGLMLFVLIGVSAHPVWLGLMLSYLLGVKAQVFPIGGYCDLHYDPSSSNLCGGPRYWAYHLVLPWLTFALLFAALYARMIRASLLETLNEDFVRTARAKGASTARVFRVHVSRFALLPVITMLGMDIGVAFAGALFIETVFQLPGMGQLLVRSLTTEDMPMIMGVVLVVSFAVVLANLIVDILYSIIDPRIRLTGKGDAVVASRRVAREVRATRRAPVSEASSS